MALMDLVSWGRSCSEAAKPLVEAGDPFVALHREMNRSLNDFVRGFGIGLPLRSGFSGTWPYVEVSDNDKELKVTAELLGMDEKSVEVSLADGVLIFKGEKKLETDDALYSERWHGQFRHSLQVGPNVDPANVSAEFQNGPLMVTLAERLNAKRSPISNS